jgi:hypothetical protein
MTPDPVPESPAQICGWVKLYHPCGALVTLPVVGQFREKAKGWDYAAAFSAVSDAIGCGFTVDAPGLEAGEARAEVGAVCRSEKTNNDRSTSQVIDLYTASAAEEYKFLRLYMDTDTQIAAFEKAARMTLDSLPLYEGEAAPTRGHKKVQKVRPFGVIYKTNPKYDEAAAKAAEAAKTKYTIPKRVFVRWADLPPDQAPPAKVDTTSTAVDETETLKVSRFLMTRPSADALTKYCLALFADLKHEYTRRACWKLVKGHAEIEGMEYDDRAKAWVAPLDDKEEPEPAGRAGVPVPF